MFLRAGSNQMCQILASQELILEIYTVFDKFNIIMIIMKVLSVKYL